MLTTRLAAIVNLPDGSLILRPDPSKMLLRKRILGVVALLVAGIALVLEVQWTQRFHEIPWSSGLSLFIGIALCVVLAWYVIKLPSLKADTMKVSVLDGLDTKRMDRSDLGFIFRGQVLRQVRGGSYWDKSYIFAAPDGTVWLSPWAAGFTAEGIAEFAQRLQVPIRGDFSIQVKDRVDPTSP